MTDRNVRLTTKIIVTALVTVWAWATDAAATPQQLSCVLTGIAAQSGSEIQPIIIMFDESAKTLNAKMGSQSYSLSNVSISPISISGDDSSLSLGIDRSSLSMVWQQYAADKVVTEYGQCRQN
jgi:hypothetical protein